MKKYFKHIVVLIILILGATFGVYQVKRVQRVLPRAAVPGGPASILITPSSEITANQPSTLLFSASTQNLPVDGFQIIAKISGTLPADISFQPASPSGLQVISSSLTPDSNQNLILKMAYITTDPQSPFVASTPISLGQLKFTAPPSGNMVVSFDNVFSKISQNQTTQDILGLPQDATYTFTLPNIFPTITTSFLPAGFVDTNYSATISGSDLNLGDALNMNLLLPYSSLQYECTTPTPSPAIAPTITCTISGTIPKAGNFPVSATLSDNHGGSVSKTYDLIIDPIPLSSPLPTPTPASSPIPTPFSLPTPTPLGAYPGVPTDPNAYRILNWDSEILDSTLSDTWVLSPFPEWGYVKYYTFNLPQLTDYRNVRVLFLSCPSASNQGCQPLSGFPERMYLLDSQFRLIYQGSTRIGFDSAPITPDKKYYLGVVAEVRNLGIVLNSLLSFGVDFPVSSPTPPPTPKPIVNYPPKFITQSIPTGVWWKPYQTKITGIGPEAADSLSMSIVNSPVSFFLGRCISSPGQISCPLYGIPYWIGQKSLTLRIRDNHGNESRITYQLNITRR